MCQIKIVVNDYLSQKNDCRYINDMKKSYRKSCRTALLYIYIYIISYGKTMCVRREKQEKYSKKASLFPVLCQPYN